MEQKMRLYYPSFVVSTALFQFPCSSNYRFGMSITTVCISEASTSLLEEEDTAESR
jgi:hypothetical protein